RTTAALVSSVVLVSAKSGAQVTSLEERHPRNAPGAEAPKTPVVAEASPVIIPPELLSSSVPYPEDATSSAQVELELLVGTDGRVQEVLSASGPEPFATV